MRMSVCLVMHVFTICSSLILGILKIFAGFGRHGTYPFIDGHLGAS